MERNRQKLVARDKGSLTEQQTKGTVTTTIQMRKHSTNCTTQRATLSQATAHLPPPEPSMMTHGMEYPALFGQVGSARPAVLLPGFR